MQVLQVQLEVWPDPAEVGRARRWARSRLAGSGIGPDEPLAETLILLISELVTNAVVHTGCPAVLRILLPDPGAAPAAEPGSGARTVRVEVADRSARAPVPKHADGDDTSGRGLELVTGLADRWGWRPEGGGKSIWCEVDREQPRPERRPLGVGAYETPCAITNHGQYANSRLGVDVWCPLDHPGDSDSSRGDVEDDLAFRR